MKNICFVVFTFFFLFYQCENPESRLSSPLSLVPSNTDILIKINSSEGLESSLKNNALIKALETYPQIKSFNELALPTHLLQEDDNLIAISENPENQVNVSYIVPSFGNQLTLDSIPEITIDSSFNRTGMRRLLYKDKAFFSTLVDSTLFISNKIELTEAAIDKQLSTNHELENIFNTSNSDKLVSVLLNHNHKLAKPKIFEDSILNQQKLSSYTMIDSDISQNAILINGITKATDSTKSLINIFKNTVPQENRIATILPADTDFFKSFTFDDYTSFQQNMVAHQFQDSISDNNRLQNIIEIGEALLKENKAVFLRSIDPSTTFETFDDILSEIDSYRDVTIYQVDDESDVLKDFSPLLSERHLNHAIVIEGFLVLSDDIPLLQNIISSYQSHSNLAKTDGYINLMLSLSDEASLLIFRNAPKLNQLLNLNFTDDINLDLSNFRTSAIQFIQDSDFAHVNAALKSNKKASGYNMISEELNIALDADIISTPQLLKNHTNGHKDIAVQDINNNLYLISNTGKVFWKKSLDGKILGSISQIDTYKNGRLQLVFNTAKQLYVLDRNGNDVKPFPLTYNDDITQPVSVFDYDKRKNYRLMITQGKSVLIYDKHGKTVTGFTYKNAKDNISSQPRHFRIGRKDYIAFTHGNKMEILDRVGKTRVAVKEKLSFSDNDIYLYKNRFTTSSTNGELLEIDQAGNVNHKNLNANSEHKIDATSKTLVVLNDNKLTIKSKTIDLDFGEYTAPKIFYINDKIYVTVTDLQSKKGYLFDSQAKSIPNFPVYANAPLELGNIDKDNALEVITKGDSDAIIVYEIR